MNREDVAMDDFQDIMELEKKFTEFVYKEFEDIPLNMAISVISGIFIQFLFDQFSSIKEMDEFLKFFINFLDERVNNNYKENSSILSQIK